MSLPCKCFEIVKAANWRGQPSFGQAAKAWQCPRCRMVHAVPLEFPDTMIIADAMVEEKYLPWKIRRDANP